MNKAVIIMLVLLLLGGCTAMREGGPSTESLRLPPITAEPTRRHHPGKFVWHDLLTPDTLASRAFYGELFGWSFQERGNYIEIYNGDRKIGGILAIRPGKEQKVAAQWLASMSVPGLDQAADFIRSGGGQILNGPMDLGKRGRGILVSDPQGAHLLLLNAKGGDPEDQEPAIGDWLWNEVWTLNPARLNAFYGTLGGYQQVIQDDDYSIFISEGVWRAGVRAIRQKAFAGRWVPVVRVQEPALLLNKVRRLGGVVWLEPGGEGVSEGTTLISDNQGAMLILQRWSFPADREGG